MSINLRHLSFGGQIFTQKTTRDRFDPTPYMNHPCPSKALFPEQTHFESDKKVYLSTGGGISRALVIPRLRSRKATRVQNIFISLALSHLLPAFSDHLARGNWRRSRLKALRGFSAAPLRGFQWLLFAAESIRVLFDSASLTVLLGGMSVTYFVWFLRICSGS